MAGYSRGADVARVGITALIATGAFLAMFGYTTGRSLTAEHRDLHIRFPSADGLYKGDAVLFRGVRIGEVKELTFAGGAVIVRVLLTEDAPLPARTTATLHAVDIFGRQSIVLQDGAGHGRLADGDTIAGSTPRSLTGRMDALGGQIGKLIGDSTRSRIHGTLDGVAETSRAIGAAAERAETVLGTRGNELGSALRGITAVTDQLAGATDADRLNRIQDNLETATARLGGVAARMDTASILLAAVLGRVAAGDGTAGRLLADPALYDSIVASLASLDALLRDLKENPKRYINVSVF